MEAVCSKMSLCDSCPEFGPAREVMRRLRRLPPPSQAHLHGGLTDRRPSVFAHRFNHINHINSKYGRENHTSTSTTSSPTPTMISQYWTIR